MELPGEHIINSKEDIGLLSAWVGKKVLFSDYNYNTPVVIVDFSLPVAVWGGSIISGKSEKEERIELQTSYPFKVKLVK